MDAAQAVHCNTLCKRHISLIVMMMMMIYSDDNDNDNDDDFDDVDDVDDADDDVDDPQEQQGVLVEPAAQHWPTSLHPLLLSDRARPRQPGPLQLSRV